MACTTRTVNGSQCGLSLIEVTVALAVSALLATVAYPSLQSAVLKARRSEALTGLAQLQLAQERHRSNHAAYASLAQLNTASAASGRYLFSEETPTPSGFSITAIAQGGQTADTSCRHLKLQVDGSETRWASGPDSNVRNDESENRRCWGQ